MESRMLNESELEVGLSGLGGWKLEDGKGLVKSRLFLSFPEAINFVNQVADIAEELNHHPFIEIDYRNVKLQLFTHDAGGLTSLDLSSAKAYDRL